MDFCLEPEARAQLACLPCPKVVKRRQCNPENLQRQVINSCDSTASSSNTCVHCHCIQQVDLAIFLLSQCAHLGGTKTFSSNRGTSFISDCEMGQHIHWFIQHEALQPPLSCSPWQQDIITTLLLIPLGAGPQTRTFDMQGQRAGGKATA